MEGRKEGRKGTLDIGINARKRMKGKKEGGKKERMEGRKEGREGKLHGRN